MKIDEKGFIPEQTLWVEPPCGTLRVFLKLLDFAHASRSLRSLPLLCLDGDDSLGEPTITSPDDSAPELFFIGGGVSSCIWRIGGLSVTDGDVDLACDILQIQIVLFKITKIH